MTVIISEFTNQHLRILKHKLHQLMPQNPGDLVAKQDFCLLVSHLAYEIPTNFSNIQIPQATHGSIKKTG